MSFPVNSLPTIEVRSYGLKFTLTPIVGEVKPVYVMTENQSGAALGRVYEDATDSDYLPWIAVSPYGAGGDEVTSHHRDRLEAACHLIVSARGHLEVK